MSDEQEALSRKYSNDVIILLPLASGRVAVFNSARELCGIESLTTNQLGVDYLYWPPVCWHPAQNEVFNEINLEELDL